MIVNTTTTGIGKGEEEGEEEEDGEGEEKEEEEGAGVIPCRTPMTNPLSRRTRINIPVVQTARVKILEKTMKKNNKTKRNLCQQS
jgi:hypothetical protein